MPSSNFLIFLQAFQATNHENLEKFCGQPDCVNGVEKLEKEYGSCYGGTLRPAWDFLEILSCGSARPLGMFVWGIGLVLPWFYLVYCSYYLVPVYYLINPFPSLDLWYYDPWIGAPKVGGIMIGGWKWESAPKNLEQMKPAYHGSQRPGMPWVGWPQVCQHEPKLWLCQVQGRHGRQPAKVLPQPGQRPVKPQSVQGSNRPCGQEKWNVLFYRSICRYVACAHGYAHAYMRTCIHAYVHTCIHAYMHTCIHEMTRVLLRHYWVSISRSISIGVQWAHKCGHWLLLIDTNSIHSRPQILPL